MKVIAISGSLRISSSNGALLQALKNIAPAGVEFEIYSDLAELPHFTPDLDGENAPLPVQQMREMVRQADRVLICTPEYAFGIPGSLKNLLDWTVSSAEFLDKPTAVITASPTGGKHAHAALVLVLGALTAQIVEAANLKMQFNRSKLNESGEVTDPATIELLQKALQALLEASQTAMLE